MCALALRATDPVCAMSVNPSQAARSAAHEGRTYYFCSKSCQQEFQAYPVQYLKPHETESGGMSASTGGTIYTCPMHPEVRQDHPGTCPK